VQCRSPVTVARSSSGGVAICYVLPVVRMTSYLVVVGPMAMSYNTGTESDVYECFVIFVATARSILSTSAIVRQHLVCMACMI